MVFNLALGFANIPDPQNKNKTLVVLKFSATRVETDPNPRGDRYAIQIADTVKVGQDTGILITEGTKKVHEVILDEDEEEEVSMRLTIR